jgi:hypothetical protein
MSGDSRLLVMCAIGVAEIDLETEEVVDVDPDARIGRQTVPVSLPLVVAADREGSRIVAVVDRRPPLVVSDDGGTTWREIGGGLPAGRDIAISPEHPDRLAFATAERLYVSRDGGRFWRVLRPELIDVTAVSWDD